GPRRAPRRARAVRAGGARVPFTLMRTLLITGPGGSGRTTVAAGTALAAARAGTRTLVLGTDRTDTLGAVLGVPVGAAPVEAAPGLTARRVEADADFREDLTALQDRAGAALDLLGASRLEPGDLPPLPGAEERALLRALRDAALSEEHDLLVVDLPPAERALALFALPGELRRYLRRLLPPERQAARALRPVLGRLAGVPLPAHPLYETAARRDPPPAAAAAAPADPSPTAPPAAGPAPARSGAVRPRALGPPPPERQAARALRPVLGRLAGVPLPADRLYETAARWDLQLAAVEAVLADPSTTVRLVAEPSPAGADAVRTAALGLALRGLRADRLVASRVLPEDVEDSWLAGPVAQQRKTLAEWRETYTVDAVAHRGRDPRGTDDLGALALPGAGPAPAAVDWPVTGVPHSRLRSSGGTPTADDGVLVWHIPLPGARREEL